jgi:hypothetical protein
MPTTELDYYLFMKCVAKAYGIQSPQSLHHPPWNFPAWRATVAPSSAPESPTLRLSLAHDFDADERFDLAHTFGITTDEGIHGLAGGFDQCAALIRGFWLQPIPTKQFETYQNALKKWCEKYLCIRQRVVPVVGARSLDIGVVTRREVVLKPVGTQELSTTAIGELKTVLSQLTVLKAGLFGQDLTTRLAALADPLFRQWYWAKGPTDAEFLKRREVLYRELIDSVFQDKRVYRGLKPDLQLYEEHPASGEWVLLQG